jgi:hypothetical protein
METARDLTVRLQDLLRREHGALADFLVTLAAFDQRRAWAELGHASLFAFLHRDLGLSKGAAFYRATAAALVQRFPEVVEPIRRGKLCLTTVVEVAKVLTPENAREVLPRFFGLSKREAQEVMAELQPREAPPLRDVVTVVWRNPAPALPLASRLEPDLGQEVGQPTALRVTETSPHQDACHPAPTPALPRAPPAPPPDAVEPLTAELTRIHVTLPRRVFQKVEAARAALSHSHPGAGLADIIEAGIDLLLERKAKRNGLVKRPRSEPRPSADPEHVPAHVRREVWKRDGGRCQHPVASGGVCGSTVRVELHHLVSRNRGGPATVENLTTLCGFHRDLETRREFGDAAIDGIVRGKRRRASPGGRRACDVAITRAPARRDAS